MNSNINMFYQLWCKNLKLYKILADKIKVLMENLYNTCTMLYNKKSVSEDLDTDIDEQETLIYKILLEMILLEAKLGQKLQSLKSYIRNTAALLSNSLTDKDARALDAELTSNQYKKFSNAYYYLSRIISRSLTFNKRTA